MYGEKSELNKLMRVILFYILSLTVGFCNGYHFVPSYILYVSGSVCTSCTFVYWRWINTPSPEMYDVKLKKRGNDMVKSMDGARFWLCTWNNIKGPMFLMMSRCVMFREIVSSVVFSWIPLNIKNCLMQLFSQPIPPHIPRFRTFGLHGGMCEGRSGGIVRVHLCRTLWMSKC